MFSLNLLGGALLVGSDGPVRGRASHRRRLALLAILAGARGRGVGREKLIGLLWPEHSTDAARHLLSESLYVLRKALGEDAFVSAGDEVGLNPAVVQSDVGAFEAFLDAGEPQRGAALYRGPLLDGFYLTGAEEFEKWLDVERDRLSRRYGDALEEAAGACESAGDPLGASAWWRKHAVHDPYSSRVVLRLMGALEAAGEHPAAIRAAAEHAEFLREELGAEPDPQVPALAERLRTAPTPGPVPPRPAQQGPGHPYDPGAGEAGDPPTPAMGRVSAEEVPRLGSSHPRLPRLFAGAALAAVLTAVAFAVRTAPEASPAEEGGFDPAHVAVLYLDDHSPDGSLAHIANGLTEGLIHELAQVAGLRVVSRNGVKPFRSGGVPIDSIARALRVGTIVEGSVQDSDDRLRVTVQLVDTRTGMHLQSRAIERPLGELFALEDALATEVSEFLRRRLGREIRLHQRSSGTRSASAREHVMRAELLRDEAARLNAHGAEGDDAVRRLARADSLLEQAARADRRWAEPWIVRGWIALDRRRHSADAERDTWFAVARRHADRALALAPESPAALELRGTALWRMVQLGPSTGEAGADSLTATAERDLASALSRDPTRASAWATLSQLLRVHQARLAEADDAARRALEEDEFLEEAPLVMERLYRSAVQLTRWDSAAAWCTRGRVRFPNDWRFAECQLTLLGYEGTAPDIREAWQLHRELEQMDPPEGARAAGRRYSPFFRTMMVARVAARAGLADSARSLVAATRLQLEGDSDLIASFASDAAYVHLLLGDHDTALALLEQHLAGRPRLRASVARDVKFRALHTDPRFRRLVEPTPEASRR